MKHLRSGLVGATIALVFIIGGTAPAGAHPSQGSTVAGAGGWLDHGVKTGDGVYSYSLGVPVGACGVLQVTWGSGSWTDVGSKCGGVASGPFLAPPGGVFFRVCVVTLSSTACGPTRGYTDT